MWLPNWPIQRAIQSRPELKGGPLALVKSAVRGSEVAVCCSVAVAQGVRPGMPLVEAQSLACGLSVAKHDPEGDRRTLIKCAEACERFSPRVAIEEAADPESLLLDVSNLDHLVKSEAQLVGNVRRFFTRRGFLVRLAVAETVGAAWGCAHFENQAPEGNDCGPGFNAKSSLPIQSLRISKEVALTLRELGIETVGELVSLPREGLASRFGAELLLRLDQFTGSAREVIEPSRAEAPFQASYALEEPTGDRSVLIFVLKQLVDQLARQLVSRDQGAILLMCVLESIDSPPVSLRVGLLQPSANARQLLELIELHLEATKLKTEVDRVELRAAVVGRLSEQQQELFADHWLADPHQMAVLVNRLSSRLGCDRVLRAEFRESPVPERRVRWASVMAKSQSQNRGSRAKSQKENQVEIPNSSSVIPLLLYPVPQAVEVMSALPGGPPQAVLHASWREAVIEYVGPERIETLWWRGTSVRRDYYRVATQAGSHLWLFRRLADQKWFLHGMFA